MTINTHAAAAKMIRAEMKKHGIVGRVRARTASMMSAVDVYVTDLPPATRDALRAFVGQFEYGTFDGMTDCYNVDNRRDDLPQVKFAHVSNEMSHEMEAEIRAWLDSYYAPGHDIKPWEVFNVPSYSDRFAAFWTARKPRQRAA